MGKFSYHIGEINPNQSPESFMFKGALAFDRAVYEARKQGLHNPPMYYIRRDKNDYHLEFEYKDDNGK